MADDSTNGTIDQHLEENGSPGTLRTLRRVRRAHQSRSANPPTGSELWDNANAAITSRHQQPLPQQQQTREQRTSAAEQELVLTAASLRRSAAARARLNGDTDADDDSNGIDGIDDDGPSILDGLEMNDVMDNDAAVMEVVDANNNGMFIDGIDYRFRWKNWSNWFVPPPPPSYYRTTPSKGR